jgi:hypothetical protein
MMTQPFNADQSRMAADSTAQLNKLLAQSAEALTCGPSCQKQKTTDRLKSAYQVAQTNVMTAPVELGQAEKAYITYVDGTAGYNSIMSNTITNQANTVCTNIQNEFNKQIEIATNLITTYNSLYTNYAYVKELYHDYVNENSETREHIGRLNSDVVTADRKTYYESQNYESLTKWYYIFRWIYIILLIAFFIGLFLAESDKSRMYKWTIFILLVLYPVVINYIIVYLLKTWSQLYTLLPKNVYKSL